SSARQPQRRRARPAVACRWGGVLGYSSLHQLPDQRSQERMVRLKTNGALAGVVILESVLQGFHHGAWVEGEVIRGCAKPYEHLSVEAEGGELVADAPFRPWSRDPDALPQRFEGGSLVVAQRSEVLVDGLWSGLDLGLRSHGFFSFIPH